MVGGYYFNDYSIIIIMYSFNSFIHVLFLQIGAHSLSQRKEPKHGQNKLQRACVQAHIHTRTPIHRVNRIA